MNRGFLNGPYCPAYGFGAALTLLLAEPLAAWPPLLFLVCALAASALQYFTGWLLEKLFQTRWWNYSGHRFQLGNRTRLLDSLVFGALGLAAVYLIQPNLNDLIRIIPPTIQRVAASMAGVILIIDLSRILFGLAGLEARLRSLRSEVDRIEKSGYGRGWLDREDLSGSLERLREKCGSDEEGRLAEDTLFIIELMIGRAGEGARILRAFPGFEHRELDSELKAVKKIWKSRREAGPKGFGRAAKKIRAKIAAARTELAISYKGVTFPRMVWVFLIACVIGYASESLYCFATRGVVESRQGMVYGPFSQVYGFGAVLMVLMLSPLVRKGDGWLFFGSALIGGVFEAACSLFQESLFGTVSWEYTSQYISFFGGRTNLLYMFFWGVLGTMYMKIIYPRLTSMISRVPVRARRFFTWAIVIFLSADMLISSAAVYRWSVRQNGDTPRNAFEEFLDRQYPDEILEEIYPNMRIK